MMNTRNNLIRFLGVGVFSIGWLIPLVTWAQTANPGGVTAQATPWEQVSASVEKAGASLAAYWQDINEDHSLKSYLIESKLNLVYADIDEFTARDPSQAAIDLQQCQYYAKHAVDNAQSHFTDDVTKGRLAAIVEQIQQLRSIPQLAKQQQRYKSLEQRIQKVITIL